MIIEQRTYTIKPLRMRDFLDIYERAALPLQRKYLGTLIGFFVSEVGPMNQVVHLWAYRGLGDREQRRHAMESDPAWTAYLDALRELEIIVAQESRMMRPTAFSPSFELQPDAGP